MKFGYILFFLIVAACQPPEYPDEPQITFMGLSTNILNECTPAMQLNNNCDTVLITMGFTDGDGDLGAIGKDSTVNCFVTDLRTGTVTSRLIPQTDLPGNIKSVSGEITFVMNANVCRNTFPPLAQDTVIYKIRIKDRAGNMSNEITTSPIYLNCK